MKNKVLRHWLCGIVAIFAVLFTIGCIDSTETDLVGDSPKVPETVIVKDTLPPSLEPQKKTVEFGTVLNYSDLATVEDDSSDEIKLNITSSDLEGVTIDDENQTILFGSIGSFKIALSATDEAGNASTGTAVVEVEDNTNPVITLTKKSFSITAGDSAPNYASAVSASDNVDGDITKSIKINSSKVNRKAAGTYEVTYTVTDSSGNTTIEEAIVKVKAKTTSSQTGSKTTSKPSSETSSVEVMITRTGECYHTHKCGNGNYFWVTLKEAKNLGLRPCKKCY